MLGTANPNSWVREVLPTLGESERPLECVQDAGDSSETQL